MATELSGGEGSLTPPSSGKLALKEGTVLFAAGAVAGLAEGIVVQPLDMIKTRFQLSTKPNPSVASALLAVVREGGVRRLYRGMLPELSGMVPKSSAMMASNDIFSSELAARNSGVVTPSIAFTAGLLSGVPEALTVTPFQTVKVRLQSKEYIGKYANTADCMAKMFREEGASAIFRGFGATAWRNCAWNAMYFWSMHQMRHALPVPSSRAVESVQTLVLGLGCGMFATLFNAPFDLVKSRVQGMVNPGWFSRPTLMVLWDTFRSEGGLASCYKGFAPKAMRMGLGSGVCLATFELFASAAGVDPSGSRVNE